MENRISFEKVTKRYLPMTETAYYILLVLDRPMHGYGIKRAVSELTNGRLTLSAGTIYGTLQKLEQDGLIALVFEQDRKKQYRRTTLGEDLFSLELGRIRELSRHETLWRSREDLHGEA